MQLLHSMLSPARGACRRHALISGVTALISTAAHADTPPDIIFYARSASPPLRYTQWDGAAWSASAQGSNVTSAPDWVQAAGCPSRAESIVLTIDSSRVARVFHHIGIYCYAPTTLTASVGGAVGRPADVVYEQDSSDALVAYWVNASAKVGWRTSSSGTLSSETQLTLPSTTGLTFLRLVPVPGTDQILMLALNGDKDFYACLWSGSAWGAVTTITTEMSIETTECFAAAFERSSGEGLLVYSPANTSDLKYRTFIGGVWSAELTGPAVTNTYDWVRLAVKPNPSSNTILLGLLDHNKGVQAVFWNGSAWGALTTFTSDAGASDGRMFDVAYTPGGANALIAYAKSLQTRPYSCYWNGTVWSAEAQGPDTADAARFIRLVRGESSSDIHVLWSDSGLDLNVALWNGAAIGAAALIDASLAGSTTTEPFGLIIPAADAAAAKRITLWNEVNPR